MSDHIMPVVVQVHAVVKGVYYVGVDQVAYLNWLEQTGRDEDTPENLTEYMNQTRSWVVQAMDENEDIISIQPTYAEKMAVNIQ